MKTNQELIEKDKRVKELEAENEGLKKSFSDRDNKVRELQMENRKAKELLSK